eukprot:5855199-Pyramimonas_sp.AAC.1
MSKQYGLPTTLGNFGARAERILGFRPPARGRPGGAEDLRVLGPRGVPGPVRLCAGPAQRHRPAAEVLRRSVPAGGRAPLGAATSAGGHPRLQIQGGGGGGAPCLGVPILRGVRHARPPEAFGEGRAG